MTCAGDLSKHVNDVLSDSNDDVDTAVDALMNESVDFTTDNEEWVTSKVPVIGPNIISLFDQLCYMVVFGNKQEMDERISAEERDQFFAGVVKAVCDFLERVHAHGAGGETNQARPKQGKVQR